jgi:transposase
MLTGMTEEDWSITLELFDAAQSRRGEPGHDDRKFLEALHYFVVHNITWRALPAEFDNWIGSFSGYRGLSICLPSCGNSATSPSCPDVKRRELADALKRVLFP